ncbi:MAG: adenosylcobinamide-GDP ribazoletransferase [Oscillospiraceae bacterium]
MQPINTFLTALSSYTRINIPHKSKKQPSSEILLLNLIFIGIIIGIMWKFGLDFLASFAVGNVVTAAILTVFPFWITRYLHLNGFMETSVEILSKKGGYTNERHGAFGMTSMGVLFVLNFAGVFQLVEAKESSLLLLFMPIISRELTILMIFLFPVISGDQYEVYKKNVRNEHTVFSIICFIVTIILCVTFCGTAGSIMAISMLLGFIFSALAARMNCGMSGDSAGYALTISETFGLIGLAVMGFVK